MDAVYCSKQCQERDHPDHCEDCVHPSEMDHEDLMEEVQMHLDHQDEHHDPLHMQIGAQLIGQAAIMGEATTEELRDWLIGALFNQTKRKFNRGRVRRQRRKTRRQKRGLRRRGKKARKGTRQANALGREKKGLVVTKTRTAKAEQRETLAQRRNL
jgi:hypothetical protein